MPPVGPPSAFGRASLAVLRHLHKEKKAKYNRARGATPEYVKWDRLLPSFAIAVGDSPDNMWRFTVT